MDSITDLFISIIEQAKSYDMAESEFRRLLIDDPDLKRQYKEYCRETGSSERNGFADFCEEYMRGENEMWNTLNDFDNQE